MPKNKLEDLRNHLFETIELLKDDDRPMEVDRARAVAEVANTILESAKVELGFIRAMDADVDSGFISASNETKRLGPGQPPAPTQGSPAADWVQCIDCGEKFPDKPSLSIHKKGVHGAAKAKTR